MEFVGSERIKRDDGTSKCVVPSAVIPCETFPLFELASQLGLGVAGMVRSSSTEIHVYGSDGSCTSPSEASRG